MKIILSFWVARIEWRLRRSLALGLFDLARCVLFFRRWLNGDDWADYPRERSHLLAERARLSLALAIIEPVHCVDRYTGQRPSVRRET